MDDFDSHNAEWILPVSQSFLPETGFIVVNIAKIDYGYLDQEVVYQNRVFQPKSELHITIISAEEAEALREYLEKKPEDAARVWEIIDETDWSFQKLRRFYHVEEKPGVETLIEMVEISNLQVFLQSLSRLTGSGILLPPTHVTLYTRGTEKGIGLPNQQTFQQLVKAQVEPGEIQAVNDDHQAGSEQGWL